MAKLNYNVNPSIFQPSYKGTKLRDIITEFQLSEKRFAEVVLEEGEYKTVEVARSCYLQAIKKMHAPVTVKVIDKKMYLVSKIWLDSIKKAGA